MDVAQIVKFVALGYLICVGVWFATAQARFSRASKAQPMLYIMVTLSLFTTLATLVTTVPVQVPWSRLILTLVTTSAAVVLIKWAFASIRKRNLGLAFSGIVPDEVVQHGPYRLVRHPLYLAYSIFWTGCAIISASVIVAIGSALVILTYILAAKSEERDLMSSSLGPQYAAYRKRTGLILPRLF